MAQTPFEKQQWDKINSAVGASVLYIVFSFAVLLFGI